MPLPDLPANKLDLLRRLNDRGVAYIVTGGAAVMFHDCRGRAADLDLIISTDRRTYEGLTEIFGTPFLHDVPTSQQFVGRTLFFDLDAYGFKDCDMIAPPLGCSFDALYADSVIHLINELPVRVCGLRGMIELKRYAAVISHDKEKAAADKADLRRLRAKARDAFV